MAFPVDLGKDSFTSPSSGISLILHASAHILPSDVDASPTDPSHIERQLRSGDLWVSQTPELALDISIPDTVLHYQDDINPPSNIPIVRLSTIKVTLSFTYNDKHTRLYLPTFMTKPKVPVHQHQAGYISIIPYDEHVQDMILFGPEQKKPEDLENSEATTFIEELEELHESEQSSSLPISHQSAYGRAPPDTQHEELYSLITTGLESLLLGNNEGNNNSEKSLQNLPQLAPSVFSPGYHKEMSQRSQLIPSIAKSLSSMLKLPNYKTLLLKINNLDSSKPTQPSPTDPSSTRNNIKAALWRIAQKQLYKPQASRNLHLLAPSLPKVQDRSYQQPWEDSMITDEQVAHMLDDENRDQGCAEEDLLGFSESDEISCEMLSTTSSSLIGSLQFSHDDDLISEQSGGDILSQTPVSEDLTFSEKSGNEEDDMLCDYI
ncbi:hypothetical protein BO78DRAFT_445269 [Aspergillus sclerotiicarbonarius CBS 121057]|uniref:Uncharacterized protein n=1 Tax=Aspergillus sclerotiicarbonarius (strain CBS 121057 / IBT 28362) TaxID=1448318 RepID=A0A319E945_ASPSB|nr:hypothetical protein BO78DRAFT_445269 [Aspergillus sclerotiicarbonarius CBS 121057]